MKLKTSWNTRICKKCQSKLKTACILILNSRLIFFFFTEDDLYVLLYQTDKSDMAWDEGEVHIALL